MNPINAAGLVSREVRRGARDGRQTRIVAARRSYATDQADLWDAMTSADRIARWFLPISGELEEGGRYQLDGNAGGTVLRCRPPVSFSVTWEYGDTVSWLDVNLRPTAEEETLLEVVHESPYDPQWWAEFGPGSFGVGWDLGLLGLGIHLDTGEPVDREWAGQFPSSAEGQRFITRTANGWARAAVAGGDDDIAARNAASRTIEFYTEPEPRESTD